MSYQSLFNITLSLNTSTKKIEDRFITANHRPNFVLKWSFYVIFLSLILVSTNSLAWGAQLDVRINPDSKTTDFQIKYQKTVFIEYPEGGDVADQLRGNGWTVNVAADKSNPGVQQLIQKLNDKITADGSSARITDLTVESSVKLTARELNTAIDYKIVLKPTLSFFILREYSIASPALIDAAWRGLTVQGPVVIDGVDINRPISVLQSQEPGVYSLMRGSEAEILLSQNLIDAEGIKNQPLGNWHFLFDPTGINVDASTFGLSEEIVGFVVSSFTMGESSIREGRQVERILEATFVADKEYFVRSVQSADSAEIDIIGFAAIETSYGAEAFGVSPTPPEGYATTATGEFPISIIYGMAGMAGIGAIAMLIFSNRKLKKVEGMGQQGIDPSQLRGFSTSASSGGYQTVRGEAQLIGESDYAQTKSVYEEEKKTESTTTDTSKKGSMPKGWKPS